MAFWDYMAICFEAKEWLGHVDNCILCTPYSYSVLYIEPCFDSLRSINNQYTTYILVHMYVKMRSTNNAAVMMNSACRHHGY